MQVRKMTDDEMRRFVAVRTRLLGGKSPYYAKAAFSVRPVAAEGLGTWAVDKSWRMYVDPNNLPDGEAGWSVEDCTDVITHELNHLLRDHAQRMEMHGGKNRDGEKSNIATDLEINDDLDEDGFVATIGVTPKKYELESNKTAEWYYDNLPEQQSNQNGGEGEGQEGQGGSGSGQGTPKCGSGGGGKPIEGELDADDSSVADGLSEGEAELARKATAQAVKEHVAQHGRGSAPGGLVEWAEVVLAPPTVPWQRVLAAAVRRGVRIAAGNQDHTYTRISRRASSVPDVALPAMFAPKPRIAVVLDTSGSMSKQMVDDALNEVNGISKQLGATNDELTLIQVDAAVGSIKPWTDIRKVELTGRGGTDMRVGIQAAAEMRTSPNVVIVLTDGETPWPDERPKGMNLVVGVVSDSEQRRAWSVEAANNAMPWAQVVEVGDK
jgi:predicted metal-dependent peptidase